MSRVNFAVEQGYDIFALNGDLLASQLSGSAAPGGDAGPQDAAPIGSIYQRTDGTLYIKEANAGATSDWKLVPSSVLSSGYLAANGTVAIGDTIEEAIEKIVGNQDDIQTSLGIAQGDVDFGSFTGSIIDDNQTAKAAFQDLEDSLENLVTLSGVALDAVDLGTFTGDIITDNVVIKTALQELETELVDTRDNVDDLITLSGVAENATDLGTFTGSIITDNSDIKGALQELETEVEAISGGSIIEETGITSPVTVDSVLVDDVDAVEWEIVVFEESSPGNKKFGKVTAMHDGTATSDASNVDDTLHTRLNLGSNFNVDVSVDLNGTGASQEMRLRVESSTAGVTVRARRTTVV